MTCSVVPASSSKTYPDLSWSGRLKIGIFRFWVFKLQEQEPQLFGFWRTSSISSMSRHWALSVCRSKSMSSTVVICTWIIPAAKTSMSRLLAALTTQTQPWREGEWMSPHNDEPSWCKSKETWIFTLTAQGKPSVWFAQNYDIWKTYWTRRWKL